MGKRHSPREAIHSQHNTKLKSQIKQHSKILHVTRFPIFLHTLLSSNGLHPPEEKRMLGSAKRGTQQSCPRGTWLLPTMGLPGEVFLLPGNRLWRRLWQCCKYQPGHVTSSLPDHSAPLSASPHVEGRRASQRWSKGI